MSIRIWGHKIYELLAKQKWKILRHAQFFPDQKGELLIIPFGSMMPGVRDISWCQMKENLTNPVPRQVFLESWGVSGQSNIIIGPQNAGLIEVDNYANRKYDTVTPGICLPTWRVLFSWSTSTMLICWNYHYGMTQDLHRATNYTRWFHTRLTFTPNKFEDHANSALLVVRRCIDGKLRRKNELTLLSFKCVLHCMHQILP